MFLMRLCNFVYELKKVFVFIMFHTRVMLCKLKQNYIYVPINSQLPK